MNLICLVLLELVGSPRFVSAPAGCDEFSFKAVIPKGPGTSFRSRSIRSVTEGLRRGGEAPASRAGGLLTTILVDLGAVGGKASRFVGDIANVSASHLLVIAGRLMRSLWQVVEFPSSLRNDS